MPSLGTSAMAPRAQQQQRFNPPLAYSSLASAVEDGDEYEEGTPYGRETAAVITPEVNGHVATSRPHAFDGFEDEPVAGRSGAPNGSPGSSSNPHATSNGSAHGSRQSLTFASSSKSSSHARSTSLSASPSLLQKDFKHRRDASTGSPLASHSVVSQPQHNRARPSRSSSLRVISATPMAAFAEPATAAQTGIMAFYENNKGVFYVLLAQVFGVLMNVTTRLLEIEGNKGLGMHPFQILFVRMTITTVLSTLYMWWSKIPHFPFGLREVRKLLLLRGIGGFFGVFGMYYSLLYLPLADATVVTFIAPSVSCFACSFLLKEPFTRLEQIGAAISFIGVTLIARPTTIFHRNPNAAQAAPADASGDAAAPERLGAADLTQVTPSQRLGAICVALVGVLGSAMAFTVMRMIGKRAHPLLSVNYFCALCTVVSATAMLILPGVDFLLPADGKEWSYLIFLGLCGFAMQFLLSAGLQREKSSRATLMVYTQMIFALIFDRLIFGTSPTALSLLGSSLILGSAIYIAIHKQSQKQREDAERALAAAQTSREDVEMQRIREEERGLVAGIDAVDDDEEKRLRNAGRSKP